MRRAAVRRVAATKRRPHRRGGRRLRALSLLDLGDLQLVDRLMTSEKYTCADNEYSSPGRDIAAEFQSSANDAPREAVPHSHRGRDPRHS